MSDSELEVDPEEFFEGTLLEEFAEEHREKAEGLLQELGGDVENMNFRGIDFIFTTEEEDVEQRTKIHDQDYNEEDYV